MGETEIHRANCTDLCGTDKSMYDTYNMYRHMCTVRVLAHDNKTIRFKFPGVIACETWKNDVHFRGE